MDKLVVFTNVLDIEPYYCVLNKTLLTEFALVY